MRRGSGFVIQHPLPDSPTAASCEAISSQASMPAWSSREQAALKLPPISAAMLMDKVSRPRCPRSQKPVKSWRLMDVFLAN